MSMTAAVHGEPAVDEDGHVGLRPKDAALLLVIDRTHAKPRVLLGQRTPGHAFIPDIYVLPGGRRDAGDHRLPFTYDLHPHALGKLLVGCRRTIRVSGARPLALAAIRKLTEETGLASGTTENGSAKPDRDGGHLRQTAPSLAKLRLVARAVNRPAIRATNDTRLFLVFAEEVGIDPAAITNSVELLDLQWVDMNAVSCLNMPEITKTVLAEVNERMKTILHSNLPATCLSIFCDADSSFATCSKDTP
jgi:8-oxo-dGTP pyrophosphatase MutT (NUDIX family)